ncbi:MAG: type II toxin-antitoxin system HicB family antitoxin [Bacteroidales bacterium]|nr:type II toxin-antitoxin system HicB family antitoxin [Bacteroidales bacterium]
MEKKIIAIIEKLEQDNFAVRAQNVKGAYGSGDTEQDAKTDFEQVLKEQAEFYFEKNGQWPDWRDFEIEYRYDFSAFFDVFPFINITKFAEEVGINPSLMRKYKNRISFASDKQKQIIQKKFEEISKKISQVQF